MLIVEVYPQDVENVPHSDASKIVVSKCKVIDQYKTLRTEIAQKPLWEESEHELDNETGSWHSIQIGSEPSTPKRDAFGRFIGAQKPKNSPLKRDKKGRFLKAARRRK